MSQLEKKRCSEKTMSTGVIGIFFEFLRKVPVVKGPILPTLRKFIF